MIKIAAGLFGLGTIGAGVVKVLRQNREIIARRLGAEIELKTIVDLDIASDRGVDLDGINLSRDKADILKDPEIQIVIELIGGTTAARDIVKEALAVGKHVVTANKALLAVCGEELYGMAGDQEVKIGFEASVGGGIPIIRNIREGFGANRIESIYGIVNGTANYILTQMTDGGAGFEAVLKEAMAKGYAEADPTYDVEGIDSAHKLAILASLAFGTPIPLDAVYTEGISEISPTDIDYARSFGYRIKLLGITKQLNGEVEVRVHPTMIPDSTLLAQVDGVLNAIYVNGDAVGPTLSYGRGAGDLPTASAVIGDLMEICRDILYGGARRVSPCAYPLENRETLPIRQMDDVVSKYFLRFTTVDQPGVLSTIAGILARHGISIASVIQKGRKPEGPVPIVMMTHVARERNVKMALTEIDGLPEVCARTVQIRVEDEEEEQLV
ncbi:MAG: homoserine dehydrogenase [bacterium]|nr:homoserine dehydrogenase [bacterium]